MRVLVCGDRNWSDREKIKRRLTELPAQTIIIHGGCRGADRISGKIAKDLGFGVMQFNAKWDKYGKAAGPIRNKEMLLLGKPDLVIAFHSNISGSRGTADMINQGKKHGVKVELIE